MVFCQITGKKMPTQAREHGICLVTVATQMTVHFLGQPEISAWLFGVDFIRWRFLRASDASHYRTLVLSNPPRADLHRPIHRAGKQRLLTLQWQHQNYLSASEMAPNQSQYMDHNHLIIIRISAAA